MSCPSATDCTAVGVASDTGPTFAERWAHGRWKIQTTRNPTRDSNLYAVSCSSPRVCTATGGYFAPGIVPIEKVLIERWNGRAWAQQPIPATARLSGVLAGVSCPSASDCTAVGSGAIRRGRQRTLVEHWNGRHWGIQSTPLVKDHAGPEFIGVTCTAPENCTAVGDYIAYPGNDQEKALAERHGG